MFQKLISLFLLISISYFSYSQFTITGTVKDSLNNKVPLATITLLKNHLSVLSLSNKDGNYEFKNVSPGDYKMIFEGIGYEKFDTTFNLTGNVVINKYISVRNMVLRNVSVVTKKPLIERKIDKLIFNVENNVNTVGSNALDILSITPMIRVLNDAIDLVGKSELKILVNDKILYLDGPSLQQYLKSIPGESISQIEIMTNPSAKYDAEGNAGLINIVLKKSTTKGISGSASSDLSISKSITLSNGVNLNYTKSNFQIFGGLNVANGKHEPFNTQEIFYQNSISSQLYYTTEYSKYVRFTGGLEYKLAKRLNIGISYNWLKSNPNTDNYATTTITNLKYQVDSIILVSSNIQKSYITNSINCHINYDIDSLGKRLVIDADVFQSHFNQSNANANSNFDSTGAIIPNSLYKFLSDNLEKSNVSSLNGVLQIPNKTGSISMGGKLSFFNNESSIMLYQNANNVYFLDPLNSNNFHYNENIQALFLNYNSKIKKWQFQTGVRAEWTQTKGISSNFLQINKNAYFNIFPTFYLTYSVSPKDILSFSYGRRLKRPSLTLLNPFLILVDRYLYLEGNPYMQPYFSNNLELSNSYNNFYTLTLSYSYSRNSLTGFTDLQNGTNIKILKFGNFLTVNNYVLDNSFSIVKLKWINSSEDISLYYSKAKSGLSQTQPITEGFGADISSINNLFFNKKNTILGGINFTYQFPYVTGLLKGSSYYFLDLSSKVLLANKKLQVGLGVRDIFKTKDVSFSQVINGVKNYTTSNNDSRRVVLNIKYSFGNNKIKRGRGYSESGEDQGRVGH